MSNLYWFTQNIKNKEKKAAVTQKHQELFGLSPTTTTIRNSFHNLMKMNKSTTHLKMIPLTLIFNLETCSTPTDWEIKNSITCF